MPTDDSSDLPRRFFTLREVAHTLGTSEIQVYTLVRSGELPAIKIGGRGQWRIEGVALERWVEERYTETREWYKPTRSLQDHRARRSPFHAPRYQSDTLAPLTPAGRLQGAR